jgi:hypothetical protein
MLRAHSLLVLLLLSPPHSFQMQGDSPAASVQQWTISSELPYSSGTTVLHFSLSGRFMRPPKSETANPPVLVLDCKSTARTGGTKGKFSTGSLRAGIPLKIDYVEPEVIHGIGYYPKVFVRIRFDDGKALQEYWTPGADKSSALFQKNMLKKMLQAPTVLITASENLGEDVVMQFDMPDSAQVVEACGLAGHNK